jgi:2-keto-4-pentenoate hydratase/2-oxohepta-3-ene-1,7-dioic acid hydratase in catechol pathway
MSNEAVQAQWSDRFGRPEPKIVCVGLNYRAHADESGIEPPRAPILFGKFANTSSGTATRSSSRRGSVTSTRRRRSRS